MARPRGGPAIIQRQARTARARARRVKHYRQTMVFTCGPSALLMAMNAQDPKVRLRRGDEFALWKEATTVFMGSKGGHGGSSALGLALAAHRRGFAVEVQCNHRDPLLITRSRKPALMEVMRLVHQRDLAAAKAAGIALRYGEIGIDAIAAKLAEGYLPLVLITCFYIHGDHTPHWIVVTGVDADGVTVNDPSVALDKGKTAADMTNLRVGRDVFTKMSHYGRLKEQATGFVGPRGRSEGEQGRRTPS
ncbi:MAG: peptidase C39 family protein [Alphaproteobacteria bacterium]